MQITGGWESAMKLFGTENLGEWGSNRKKPSVGGIDIFWNHTM